MKPSMLLKNSLSSKIGSPGKEFDLRNRPVFDDCTPMKVSTYPEKIQFRVFQQNPSKAVTQTENLVPKTERLLFAVQLSSPMVASKNRYFRFGHGAVVGRLA